MKPFLLISSILLTLLFISCDPDGPVGTQSADSLLFQSEKSPYRFYGTVIDSNNNPIPFTDIHFAFKMVQPLSKGSATKNPMPSTRIGFTIPDSGHATIRVFRLGTRELITTLVDTTLQKGSYFIAYNAAALTNGFYIYELRCGNFFEQKLLPFVILDMSQLLQTTPLIKTDPEGKFSLPIGVFALEEKFVRTDDMGNEIGQYMMSDSIGFVLYKGSGEPTIEWTKINRYGNTEKTFVVK